MLLTPYFTTRKRCARSSEKTSCTPFDYQCFCCILRARRVYLYIGLALCVCVFTQLFELTKSIGIKNGAKVKFFCAGIATWNCCFVIFKTCILTAAKLVTFCETITLLPHFFYHRDYNVISPEPKQRWWCSS